METSVATEESCCYYYNCYYEGEVGCLCSLTTVWGHHGSVVRWLDAMVAIVSRELSTQGFQTPLITCDSST